MSRQFLPEFAKSSRGISNRQPDFTAGHANERGPRRKKNVGCDGGIWDTIWVQIRICTLQYITRIPDPINSAKSKT